jgi:plastocyanin
MFAIHSPNGSEQPLVKALAGLFVLIAVTTAACGGDAKETAKAAPAGDTVTMRLIAYRPANLKVPAGTTVTWSQKDAGVHTVTSGTVVQGGGGVNEEPDGKFASGQIATGGTYKFTFDEPGTYPYFCDIHPATMRGEVQVS